MDFLPPADVVVVGAGLAGTQAALAAAGEGCRVCLASLGPTFSGSSFSAATWGFGLVGPLDAADADDLLATILSVGQGMAIEELARTLVDGVAPAVERLERLGCELRRPAPGHERDRDYIPCFDHAPRSWHGIGRAGYARAVGAAMERLPITRLEGLELLDVLAPAGHVAGAVFFDHRAERFAIIPCRALVLATGGLGGLYASSFEPADVAGTAQAIALELGCSLINSEFIQIMCALEEPAGVIFNERTFRYARFDLEELPAGSDAARALANQALLEMRSAHGPLTARLADNAIDRAIAACGPAGAKLRYELPHPLPDFIQTYFSWFAQAHGGRSLEDSALRIRPYAHASNGGILIDDRARCIGGPDGLFACGECTGSMHGADRIGGLASASALVFGHIAGLEATGATGRPVSRYISGAGGNAPAWLSEPCLADAGEVAVQLGELLDSYCLVKRDDHGLSAALDGISSLMDGRRIPDVSDAQRAASRRATLKLLSAKALVTAMLARKESRGAHLRVDAPGANPLLATPRQIALNEVKR